VNQTNDALRTLVDLRTTIQRDRIAFNNRLRAIERGVDVAGERELGVYQRYHNRFSDLEAEITDDLRDLAGDSQIIQRMCAVKGVSFTLAAKVVSLIDISRADHVSNLWRYAGYAVVDGKRERMHKGEKSHYNRRLKTACFQVAESFLKSRSPYSNVYYEAKKYYLANRPDWTKNHCHLAAMGKMIKVWLSHVFLIWRQLEGLPVNEPYVISHMGHVDYITPQEMGWME